MRAKRLAAATVGASKALAAVMESVTREAVRATLACSAAHAVLCGVDVDMAIIDDVADAIQAPRFCAVCGDRIERPERGRLVCYGCHLDGLVPGGYEHREDYRRDPQTGLPRAGCRPPTHRPILDDGKPAQCFELAQRAGRQRLQTIARAEANLGVAADDGDE